MWDVLEQGLERRPNRAGQQQHSQALSTEMGHWGVVNPVGSSARPSQEGNFLAPELRGDTFLFFPPVCCQRKAFPFLEVSKRQHRTSFSC